MRFCSGLISITNKTESQMDVLLDLEADMTRQVTQAPEQFAAILVKTVSLTQA